MNSSYNANGVSEGPFGYVGNVVNTIVNKVLLGICAYLLIAQFNDIKQTQANTEALLISGAKLEQWVKNNEQRIYSLESWRLQSTMRGQPSND